LITSDRETIALLSGEMRRPNMAQLSLLAMTSLLILQSATSDVAAEPAAASWAEQLNNDESSDLSADKRYMRFGRAPFSEFQDGDVINKRYLRFGRSGYVDDDDLDEEKRYMRFGKRYMRFGRGGLKEEDKRYLRFGRNYDAAENSLRSNLLRKFLQADDDDDEEATGGSEKGKEGHGEEKRYMRFGRRSLLNEGAARLSADKRYLRFGRR